MHRAIRKSNCNSSPNSDRKSNAQAFVRFNSRSKCVFFVMWFINHAPIKLVQAAFVIEQQYQWRLSHFFYIEKLFQQRRTKIWYFSVKKWFGEELHSNLFWSAPEIKSLSYKIFNHPFWLDSYEKRRSVVIIVAVVSINRVYFMVRYV